MTAMTNRLNFLRRFERGLNPRFPDKSVIPATVLGYGEISTVLDIESGAQAYKRMPMFISEAEAESYEQLYCDYIDILRNRIGLNVLDSGTESLIGDSDDRVTVYIIQDKLPEESMGHKVIHRFSEVQVVALIQAILSEMKKVFEFNLKNKGVLEIGFDGQISNWAIKDFYVDNTLSDKIELIYFDTSTPLIRKNSAEQLNPELFLRSAPSFLVWIIRLLFLKDVMNRYYDFRQVTLDLIANFYKENRAELIPRLIDMANRFFKENEGVDNFKPFTLKEVRSYYREDAWIWRIYLAFRKIDRFLYRLFGKTYPYILPKTINR